MAIDYTKRAAAPAPAVSLSKVSLTKASPSVSLTKQTGRLRVNLNWDAQPQGAASGGFLKRLGGAPGIDLDLGCLFELTDGRKGVVQALGNAFGSLDQPPYIQLSGDDRSGASTGGEDLFVNLAHVGDLRRILVFASIYEGVPSFDRANGVVTLTPANGPEIEVRLDEEAGGSRMCAIALLESNGTELSVRREVRYIKGTQSALDAAYGWGMRWTAGRK
jgi:tellurite resistance protein TerA